MAPKRARPGGQGPLPAADKKATTPVIKQRLKSTPKSSGGKGFADGGKGFADGGKGFADGGKGFADGGEGFAGSGKGFADGGKGSGGKGWWPMATDVLMDIGRLQAQLRFLEQNMWTMRKGFAGSGKGGGKGFAGGGKGGGKGSGGTGWWPMACNTLMAIGRLQADIQILNQNMWTMP